MKVLILDDFLKNAPAIKEKLLKTMPGIDTILICYSRQEAIFQIEQHGIHMIVLDLEAEGASDFLSSINKHPHRIISTATNYRWDYFTERLMA